MTMPYLLSMLAVSVSSREMGVRSISPTYIAEGVVRIGKSQASSIRSVSQSRSIKISERGVAGGAQESRYHLPSSPVLVIVTPKSPSRFPTRCHDVTEKS
ncbi:hypothetical protein B0T21DRAFT_362882 [Apiosordaria backusii]|uniref:Uncharacterized protein n=1 Tax=Apiosordaria backusii TaxID=314023 RepID=A0AA40BSJ1_9PEZI|nr:hypothetical protein B0T21DRAFT_362882 [Apiosordaria backusii]